MQKKNLKVLIDDIERALAELKSEVYSDTTAYRISSDTDRHTTYLDINDEDGLATDYENPGISRCNFLY